jgi:hypothetical protein
MAQILKYVKIPQERFQKLPDGKAHEPLWGLGWKFYEEKLMLLFEESVGDHFNVFLDDYGNWNLVIVFYKVFLFYENMLYQNNRNYYIFILELKKFIPLFNHNT